MLLLIVDTGSAKGGVALAEIADEPIAEHASDRENATILGEESLETRDFSRQLIPAISRLLDAHGRHLSDIDAFVVISGPGSFTGLRVGLSAVKAMAEASGMPVIALSRLAVLASAAARHSGRPAELVHAVLDAGRGDFYHGVYRDAGRTRVGEAFENREELLASLGSQPGIIAAPEPAVGDFLRSAGFKPTTLEEITVGDALPLALEAWAAHDLAEIASLDANYLRRMNPGIAPEAAGSK
jgi:tRNA threonylcarbamoyladenosine biosynthesis protein TsaB